jgi:hypothetical protein
LSQVKRLRAHPDSGPRGQGQLSDRGQVSRYLTERISGRREREPIYQFIEISVGNRVPAVEIVPVQAAPRDIISGERYRPDKLRLTGDPRRHLGIQVYCYRAVSEDLRGRGCVHLMSLTGDER